MKAIIFDFDGTIGDSFKVMLEIAHKITHLDQLVMPEEIVRFRKLKMIDVANELKVPKWQWPFLLIRGRRQMKLRMQEVLPFPGISDALLTLKKDRYQLFIMSSNSKSNIEHFCAEHGLLGCFDQIYGGISMLGKTAALRRILKQNHLQAKEVIYVGDEPRDIDAATHVGMPCVGVSWGYNDPSLLAEHSPMVVVSTPKQLLNVLEEWGSEIS